MPGKWASMKGFKIQQKIGFEAKTKGGLGKRAPLPLRRVAAHLNGMPAKSVSQGLISRS
jgi:hypothetical protein